MTPPDRCPTCGNHSVDSWHLTRCAYLADIRFRVVEHAAKAGIPAVEARDLWAHMREISDDGEQAFRRVMAVIDLGWRPTEGATSGRRQTCPACAGAMPADQMGQPLQAEHATHQRRSRTVQPLVSVAAVRHLDDEQNELSLTCGHVVVRRAYMGGTYARARCPQCPPKETP